MGAAQARCAEARRPRRTDREAPGGQAPGAEDEGRRGGPGPGEAERRPERAGSEAPPHHRRQRSLR